MMNSSCIRIDGWREEFLVGLAGRAGLGPNPTRNLTRGSRVFKNPNRTGSFFGEPEVTRGDKFLTRATRAQ